MFINSVAIKIAKVEFDKRYSCPIHKEMNAGVVLYKAKHNTAAIKNLKLNSSLNTFQILTSFPSATRFPTPAVRLLKIADINCCTP